MTTLFTAIARSMRKASRAIFILVAIGLLFLVTSLAFASASDLARSPEQVLMPPNSEPLASFLGSTAVEDAFTLIKSSNKPYRTHSLAWGDYDGDGDLDLAVGNGTDRTYVDVYRNDNGTLGEFPVWESVDRVMNREVAWGDYDNDGDLDLATGNSCAGGFGDPCPVPTISLYRNDNGVLTPSAVYSSTDPSYYDNIQTLVWGDYDGDGFLDLFAGRGCCESLLYHNNGGVLSPTATRTFPHGASSAAWADFDADGDLDLITGAPGDYLRIYQNTNGSLSAGPVWSDPTPLPYSLDTNFVSDQIATGDYNADGKPDVAVGIHCTNCGGVRVYQNTSTNGSISLSQVYTSDASIGQELTSSVAWVDYDGDGDLDLATASRNDWLGDRPSRLYRNDDSVLTATPVFTFTETNGKSMAWADVDGDGDLEVVFGNHEFGWQLYQNNSSLMSRTASPIWSPSVQKVTSVAWGDYDNDGDLDIAVGGGATFNLAAGNLDPGAAPVYVYRNDGGLITNTPVWISNETADARSVAWGDVDGDGDLDLAVANWGGQNRLYRNDGIVGGVPQFTLIWTSVITEYTSSLAWGDVDGDGDLDLVAGNNIKDINNLQTSSLYLNVGGTLATTPTHPFATGDNSSGAAWGDYDQDGDLDLTLGGGWGSFPRIYRNENGQLRLSQSLTDVGAGQVAWGDVNGDGDLDLMATQSASAKLYLNNKGTLPSTPAWSSSDRGGSIALGDYDGDGDLDLAFGQCCNSPVMIYRNVGGTFSSRPVWSSAEGNRAISLAWGDVDGDGDLDLLVGNNDEGGSNPPSRIYLNQHENPGAVGQSIPTVHAARPKPDANFFSIANILGGTTIPLTYTLADPQGDKVGVIRAYYSPDGGGKWYPAAATSSTITQNLTTTVGIVLTSALSFDGINDYVNVGGTTAFSFDGLTPFSLEAWVKPKTGGNGGTVIGKFNAGVRGEYVLTVLADGRITFHREVAPWDLTTSLTRTVPFNQFSHIAATYDGATMKIYINGALAASMASGAQPTDTGTPILIGAVFNNNAPAGFFNGVIDEVRLWKVARTQAQIQTDMSHTLTETQLGMAGYWRFDEGAGATAFDSTTSYHHGTLGDGIAANQPTWTAGAPLVSLPTKAATLSFDGVDDYGTFGNVSGLASGNVSHTIEAWIKADQLPSGRSWPLLLGSPGLGAHHWLLNSNGMMQIGPWGVSGVSGQVLPFLPLGQWTHIAAAFNGITLTVYLNGQPAGSVTTTFNLQGVPLQIGLASGSENYFGGQLDELRVWNYARSQAQIQAMMGQTLQGNEPGLVGYWRLNEGHGTTVNDLTSNNNDGTLVNGPSWLTGIPSIPRVPGVARVFNWDTFGSGFFGQSDNVVFRLEAYPSLTTRPKGVPVFQRPYASSTTFPFRVRGTQVRVISGTQPISNAIVYRLPFTQTVGALLFVDGAGIPFRTDGQGYLQGRGQIHAGDGLVALYPISATDSYTLYYTSATPTVNGLNMYIVPSGGGVFTPTISAARPLILFNLDISLEWDARKDAPFLNQLQFDLNRASQILYDVTNGQAALGQVRVYHNREHWDEAHIQIAASNALRPYAAMGGVVFTPTVEITHSTVITYEPGHILMGATWNRYGDPGVKIGEDWPRALAHELGHYLFFEDDNYLGFDAEGNLKFVNTCTGSIMSDAYRDDYSEFKPRSTWLPGCADTLANRITGRADWETALKFYSALTSTLNAGPASLPLAVTQVQFMTSTASITATLDDPRFYLKDAGGASIQPARDARAFLYRGDRLIAVGQPVVDQVVARGAQEGDRLCVYDLSNSRFGCRPVTLLGSQELSLTTVISWTPDIRVTLPNTRTLYVQVRGVPTGANLLAQLFYDTGVLTRTMALAGDVYTTTFNLSGTLSGYVRITRNPPSPPGDAIVAYGLGGNVKNPNIRGRNPNIRGGGPNIRGGGAPVVSNDGQVTLYMESAVFPQDTFYMVQRATSLPNVPAWLTPVGSGYWITTSTGAPSVVGGSLSMGYAQQAVPLGTETWLRMYAYTSTLSGWQPLSTTVDITDNTAIAAISGPGLYALMTAVEIPLYGPGWDLFAYPVEATLPVTPALQSIDPYYSIVYWYNGKDTNDPWKMYAKGVLTEVIDLHDLRFGEAYWISLTQSITLYLGSGSRTNAPNMAMNLQSPPATYYGLALAGGGFTPTLGLAVTALIDGKPCGWTQTMPLGGQIGYSVNVFSDGPGGASGCGAPGRTVTFQVDGQPMTSRAAWDNDRVWQLHLFVATAQVYLPLIRK